MYEMNNAFQTYKQQKILTANPIELIILLYDGCIKQLKIATLAVEEKDYERANESMQKAQRIMMELLNSLDLRYSIAKDLMMLYEFLIRQIMDGNASKNAQKLVDVIRILGELRESWAQLAKSGISSVAQMGE